MKLREELQDLINEISPGAKKGGGHGAQAFDSASELSLPLSPLMDAKLIHNRTRYTAKKSPLSEPTTEFEKAIAGNPFASILASPLRFCSTTQVRLPSALLIPETVKKNPQTGAVSLVPASFSALDLKTALCEADPLGLDGSASEANKNTEHTDKRPRGARKSNLNDYRRPKGELRAYVAGTRQAFEQKTSAMTREGSKDKMRLNFAWGQIFSDKVVRKMHVREDMPSFVLNLLQGRAMRHLVELAQRENPPVRPATDSSALEYMPAEADEQRLLKPYVLWLGPAANSRPGGTPNRSSLEDFVRDRGMSLNAGVEGHHFSMIGYPDGASMPALDLTELFNPAQIQWLQGQCDVYRNDIMIILPGAGSVEALTWLWRLVVYIGEIQVEEGAEAGEKEHRG